MSGGFEAVKVGNQWRLRIVRIGAGWVTDDHGNPLTFTTKREANYYRRNREELMAPLARPRGDLFIRVSRKARKPRDVPPTRFGSLK